MNSGEVIALLMLIFTGVMMLVYIGQLFVLILVYLRVIKSADENAKERQAALDRAADQMRETGKYIETNLNKMAQRNTLGMAAIGVLAGILLLRAVMRKE